MNNNNNSQPTTQSKPAAHNRRDALDKLAAIIRIFHKINPAMSLSQILVFLEIAKKESVEALELRKVLGFEKSTYYRNVQAISPSSYHKAHSKPTAGLNLIIQEPSTIDGRAQILHLTEKGKKITEKLLSEIN